MSLADSLTPKNTEELKPGLFIQKTKKGYRQIEPMAWKGKLRTKEQLRTIFSLRTLVFIAIISFIAWSYVNDTRQLTEFYSDVTNDPIAFCVNAFANNPNVGVDRVNITIIPCTEFQRKSGLCLYPAPLKIIGEDENSSSSLS